MNTPFLLMTIAFVIISVAMILIILVQRPAGGGLAGAFGGAGGSGSETVFGGRVGDALTWATVIGFVLYLSVAVTLNKLESTTPLTAQDDPVPALGAPAGQPAPVQVPQTPADRPTFPGPAVPGTGSPGGDAPQGVTPIITPVDPAEGADVAPPPDGDEPGDETTEPQ